MKIKCIFGLHKFEFSRYESPFENKIITPIAIHFDGSISGGEMKSFGFLHYGIVSDCVYCGKTVSSETMRLPILEPIFTKETQTGKAPH